MTRVRTCAEQFGAVALSIGRNRLVLRLVTLIGMTTVLVFLVLQHYSEFD